MPGSPTMTLTEGRRSSNWSESVSSARAASRPSRVGEIWRERSDVDIVGTYAVGSSRLRSAVRVGNVEILPAAGSGPVTDSSPSRARGFSFDAKRSMSASRRDWSLAPVAGGSEAFVMSVRMRPPQPDGIGESRIIWADARKDTGDGRGGQI